MMILNKDRLEASLCRDSLFDFVKRFWSTIISEPAVWNWHIEFLCGELQSLASRVFLRQPKLHDLIINISPGTTKSTICSVMFPAWCWTRDPSLRIICGSYAFPLSLYLASQCRAVLSSDKYRTLFPEVRLDDQAKTYISTVQKGQRIAASTGGSITGMHGHIIVIDDPINPKEAVSKAQLQSANEWFDHTLLTRKVDKTITPLILIMQRLHQTDPTGYLLEKGVEAIRHICLPAELTRKVRPRALRHRYVEGLFDPVRLPRQILERTRKELGEYVYAGQFLQDPIPQGGGMFKADMIRIEDTAPKMVRVVRYWDKAGTSRGGAFSVGVKMGVDSTRRFWVLHVRRGQWDAAERERVIEQTAQMDGREVLVGIEQEPGSGGKESAQGTMKRLAGFRVIIDRPSGDKELRADPFAVQVNGENVSVLRGEWTKAYLDELAFFPRSRYKDQVDASSGAFAVLTKYRRPLGGLR